eukprot:484734-Pelagomonas_calceolata.AAC.2
MTCAAYVHGGKACPKSAFADTLKKDSIDKVVALKYHDCRDGIVFHKGFSKHSLGASLVPTDLGSADRLAIQNLQIPEIATNKALPKFIFPHRFPETKKSKIKEKKDQTTQAVRTIPKSMKEKDTLAQRAMNLPT